MPFIPPIKRLLEIMTVQLNLMSPGYYFHRSPPASGFPGEQVGCHPKRRMVGPQQRVGRLGKELARCTGGLEFGKPPRGLVRRSSAED